LGKVPKGLIGIPNPLRVDWFIKLEVPNNLTFGRKGRKEFLGN